MSNKLDRKADPAKPMVYQIRLKGHLDHHWTEWFEEMTFTHEEDGTTTLYGLLPDQAALHSILRKIRDLNLQLISVKQVKLDPEDETKTNSNGSVHFID